MCTEAYQPHRPQDKTTTVYEILFASKGVTLVHPKNFSEKNWFLEENFFCKGDVLSHYFDPTYVEKSIKNKTVSEFD